MKRETSIKYQPFFDTLLDCLIGMELGCMLTLKIYFAAILVSIIIFYRLYHLYKRCKHTIVKISSKPNKLKSSKLK